MPIIENFEKKQKKLFAKKLVFNNVLILLKKYSSININQIVTIHVRRATQPCQAQCYPQNYPQILWTTQKLTNSQSVGCLQIRHQKISTNGQRQSTIS